MYYAYQGTGTKRVRVPKSIVLSNVPTLKALFARKMPDGTLVPNHIMEGALMERAAFFDISSLACAPLSVHPGMTWQCTLFSARSPSIIVVPNSAVVV